jgi:methionyl-tRNA formyltransferase
MKSIILAGFGDPLIQVYFQVRKDFRIIGIIKDYKRFGTIDEEFEAFLNENKVKEYRLSDIAEIKPDLIFVINFNKIIDTQYLENTFTLNLHIGLLPKYRGNNANAWAIMNGERIVGYTIHEVKTELDSGDIYYKFQYEIKDGETYLQAKNAINDDINKNICQTLKNIIDGRLKRISQSGHDFIYACRLRSEDGIISSWNLTSSEIIDKHIIFAKPLGTGLKFAFQGAIYEITKVSLIPGFANSRGICGAIVMKTGNGAIWVKTADSAVSIDEICLEGKKIEPTAIFKIGDRL